MPVRAADDGGWLGDVLCLCAGLPSIDQIAESKGNAGKAVEWLVWVAWCQDRAKQSSEARDTLKKALLDDSSSPQVRKTSRPPTYAALGGGGGPARLSAC